MTKSEAQTRSELIDRHLSQSGWNVKDTTQVVEEFDILINLPEGVPVCPHHNDAPLRNYALCNDAKTKQQPVMSVLAPPPTRRMGHFCYCGLPINLKAPMFESLLGATDKKNRSL